MLYPICVLRFWKVISQKGDEKFSYFIPTEAKNPKNKKNKKKKFHFLRVPPLCYF